MSERKRVLVSKNGLKIPINDRVIEECSFFSGLCLGGNIGEDVEVPVDRVDEKYLVVAVQILNHYKSKQDPDDDSWTIAQLKYFTAKELNTFTNQIDYLNSDRLIRAVKIIVNYHGENEEVDFVREWSGLVNDFTEEELTKIKNTDPVLLYTGNVVEIGSCEIYHYCD